MSLIIPSDSCNVDSWPSSKVIEFTSICRRRWSTAISFSGWDSETWGWESADLNIIPLLLHPAFPLETISPSVCIRDNGRMLNTRFPFWILASNRWPYCMYYLQHRLQQLLFWALISAWFFRPLHLPPVGYRLQIHFQFSFNFQAGLR